MASSSTSDLKGESESPFTPLPVLPALPTLPLSQMVSVMEVGQVGRLPRAVSSPAHESQAASDNFEDARSELDVDVDTERTETVERKEESNGTEKDSRASKVGATRTPTAVESEAIEILTAPVSSVSVDGPALGSFIPDGGRRPVVRRGASLGRERSSTDFSDDLDLLPPLEPLFSLVDGASLSGSLENDLLPSTPLTEEQLRHADSVLKEGLNGVPINTIEEGPGAGDEEDWGYDIRGMIYNAAEQAEEFAISIWHKLQSWKVVHFTGLPQWLQDNDFLHFGHRPPLPTSECFKSITRIHTETGNIWTHLLGVVAFLGLAIYFLSRPLTEIQLQEKLVFSCFFAGAIVCMGLSFLYHTLCCHKNRAIGKLFAKFDYCGIAFLTVGSFVPWLYFSFYCDWKPQVIYLAIVIVLGVGAVVVSTFDFFAGPRFRPLRAGVFIFFGLSGIAPATHYGVVNGWEKSLEEAALGWLILMGILYITGALLYAGRIPERFFPGKVDIWFHSHQIFHCFVIAGSFVHYHGISLMALYRLKAGECPVEPVHMSCLVNATSPAISDEL